MCEISVTRKSCCVGIGTIFVVSSSASAKSGFFIPLQRVDVGEAITKYSYTDLPRPETPPFVTSAELLDHKHEIHIALGGSSRATEDGSQFGCWAFTMLGAQFLPVEFRGDCAGDSVTVHWATCIALQKFCEFLKRKRHRFRQCNITVLSCDETLLKIVSNFRKNAKVDPLESIQFETQQMFDKTRDEVHRNLEIRELFSDKKAKFPWTRWACKLASQEELGELREYSPGNFPLDAGSIPHITEVIQQYPQPPPQADPPPQAG